MTAPLNGLNELDCLKIIAGNVSGGGGGSSTLALPVTLTGAPNYTFNQGNGDASSLGDLVLSRVASAGFPAYTIAYHTLALEGQLNSTLAFRDGISHREFCAMGYDYETYPGVIPIIFEETSAVDAPSPALTGNITAGQSAKSSTVTISIASPAVVSWTSHGLIAGTPVIFSNSGGTLPTGIANGTQIYFVLASGLTANAFEISLTPGGTPVVTSGSQSGTQSAKTPLVYTSDTAWGVTYVPGSNQAWPVGGPMTVNFSGVAPSGLNGVHWCNSIDTTHFWVSFAEFGGSPSSISSVSGATFATTQTAPARRLYTSSDFNSEVGYSAVLRRSFEQDGSWFLNDRLGTRVFGHDKLGSTLTIGNLSDGGPMGSVSFHSSIYLASGQAVYFNTTQTGVANPAAIFASGGGIYTTNGGTIGFSVPTSAVATNTAITSGSTSGTVSSASGISNGMSVIGPGIRAGTTITISGTTITLSLAAVATNAAAPLTFYTPVSALLCDQSGNVTVTQIFSTILYAASSTSAYVIWRASGHDGQNQIEAVASQTGFGQDNWLEFNQVISGSRVRMMTMKGLGQINLAGIPISSSGLVSGDVYSNAGILTIVP